MRFEDLNWMDVEEYLKHDDRLILVIGACEQHGFLSLLTDIKIPLALADAAAQRTGVLVAPPLNFGSSPYFLHYPGTFSLRLTTLLDAVEDIVRSALAQGFKRLLVLNGHGGNNGVKARLTELANELPGVEFQWYAWWTSHSLEAVARRHELKPFHANWLEAFPFTIVSDLPDGDKVPPIVPSDILDAGAAREVYGDGSFGGRYRVADEIMQEVFDACLADVVQLLKFGGA
ncbi:MAG: creatininase family protein [Anaerolineales bacterium]|nr:creatininase family protein [Anaerolineales bacterium]